MQRFKFFLFSRRQHKSLATEIRKRIQWNRTKKFETEIAENVPNRYIVTLFFCFVILRGRPGSISDNFS